ncbi:MAG: DUF368 domain-containing protein [bacterium]|nr:DUF368 domain-containing protein [bacterium]
MKNRFKDDLILMLKGGAVGVANIIPGVSGGTIAVVLKIYEYLIEAISNVFSNKEKRREYLLFLIKVAFGALVVVFLSAKLMKFLLENYYIYTNLAFVGLIAGSIPSIYQSHNEMKVTSKAALSFILGMAVILTFEIAFPQVEKQERLKVAFELSTNSALMLMIAGFFAGGSMIVPGISGSFIMLLMGQYYIVTSCVADRELLPLSVVGFGIVIGIIVFAKLINFLFKKYRKETFYFILGLVIASLYTIFPGLPEQLFEATIAVVITIMFFMVSFIIGKSET